MTKHSILRNIEMILNKVLLLISKVLRRMGNNELMLRTIHTWVFKNEFGDHVKLHGVCKISDSKIGSYTYFGGNCTVKHSTFGKFCSVGPNLICGWGLHPVNGISTSPAFYSTAKQNGMSFCYANKIEEYIPITVGNDVFIGANVFISDGVIIGNGAVIGAGAVVTKDIPAYAIAGGVPAKVIRYRFDQQTIDQLQQSEWWNMKEYDLKSIEKHFFNVPDFLKSIQHT